MRALAIALLAFISTHAFSQDYAPGQTWAYKTRATEQQSTITVLKVENYKDLGDVIHIRIDHVKMTNPVQGNEITDIPHLPFKKTALDASVTQLKGMTSVPDFQEGYDTWRAAYDAGQAGAFGTSVKETLDALLGADWVDKREI